MYFRLVNHYPAMGKANELRALLEDRVKTENASGSSRSALLTEMMGPEPILIQAIQHESFAAWQAHTARIGSDQSFQATAAKMQPTMSRPQTMELYNVIARYMTDKAANFLWSVSFYPALGKAADLRRLLEERVKTATDRGAATASLLNRLYGPEGAYFMLANTFSDLAGLEAYRTVSQASPIPGLQAVTDSPTTQRLARVLIPFPAA